MKTTIISILAMPLALATLTLTLAFSSSSCSSAKGVNPDGSTWSFVSVLENTTDEERIVDSHGMQERKIGKNQTEGGAIVSKTILGSIIADRAGKVLEKTVESRSARKIVESQERVSALQIQAESAETAQRLANEAALAEGLLE